jgi:hypothetical protein
MLRHKPGSDNPVSTSFALIHAGPPPGNRRGNHPPRAWRRLTVPRRALPLVRELVPAQAHY